MDWASLRDAGEANKGLHMPQIGALDASVASASSRYAANSCGTAPLNDMLKSAATLTRGQNVRFRGSGNFARTAMLEVRDLALGTSWGLFITLFLLGILQLGFGTWCWSLSGGTDDYDSSLNDSFWISWGLFFDPGTQTNLPASDPPLVRMVAVGFSVLGFIYNLTLMGTAVEGMRGAILTYKEMYSRISATGHVLVLGWGDKTPTLLCELLAREKLEGEPRWRCCRRRGIPVVVLADRPVNEMQQLARMHLHFEGLDPSGVRYRCGSPVSRTELMKVSAPAAADVVIMDCSRSAFGADQHTVEILMALGALPNPMTADAIAEVYNEQGLPVLRTILPSAEGLLARRDVSRILVLRAVMPSLGFVFLETGSFRRRNRFYFVDVPKRMLGVTIRDACAHFPDAVLCGVRPESADEDAAARSFFEGPAPPQLVCDGAWVLREGDRLLMLAPSASAARHIDGDVALVATVATPTSPTPPGFPPPLLRRSRHTLEEEDASLVSWRSPVRKGLGSVIDPSGKPRTVLVLGCPLDFPDILHAIAGLVTPGSEVHVMSSRSTEWRDHVARRHVAAGRGRTGTTEHMQRIKVHHIVGDVRSECELRALPLEKADCALVLAEQEEGEAPAACDSRNLAAVVALRAILTEVTGSPKKCKVVTELLDPKSQQVLDRNNTVRVLGSFVYSNCVSAGAFAMAAAERAVFEIWRELLDPQGCCGHIVSVPAHDIVSDGEELSFYDLQGRVWDLGGGALLGWRRAGERYPELGPLSQNGYG